MVWMSTSALKNPKWHHYIWQLRYIRNKEWQAVIIIIILIGILPDSSQQDNLTTSSYQGQGVQDRVMHITVKH